MFLDFNWYVYVSTNQSVSHLLVSTKKSKLEQDTKAWLAPDASIRVLCVTVRLPALRHRKWCLYECM